MHTDRPPPDLHTFHEWLAQGRYVHKNARPAAYRVTDFQELYRHNQTEPLPAARSHAAPLEAEVGTIPPTNALPPGAHND